MQIENVKMNKFFCNLIIFELINKSFKETQDLKNTYKNR